MGADGGVCWVTLRKGKNRSDFEKLFEPWASELLSEDRGSSWGDDSRYDFISANDLGSCVGSYGTDIYGPSLDDLQQYVMHFLQECINEGCVTWKDVFMSVYTRPSLVWRSYSAEIFTTSWMENTSPYVPRLMDSKGSWETALDALWRHLESPDASPFWDRNLREWVQELSQTVEGSWEGDVFIPYVPGEETWT